MQSQLQAVMTQKNQSEARLMEINKTLEELDKLGENPTIYKSIGNLLIKTDDQESIKNDLEEQKEILDVRVSSFARQEKELSDRFKELEETIRSEMVGPDA